MACEFLGRLTSLQIAALEDRDQLAGRASRRATEDELARAMRESAPEDNVLEVLLSRPKELMGMVGATLRQRWTWVSIPPISWRKTPGVLMQRPRR